MQRVSLTVGDARINGTRSTGTGQIGLQLPRYLAFTPPPPQHLPPQDEDIPARKKPRLETPVANAMALPPPADVDDDDDDDGGANTDSVTDTQSNPRATRATARWTPEEDTELTT
jgi:hypothetical protein